MCSSDLPCGERLQNASCTISAIIISIHAPARGATRSKRANLEAICISIHAPARGATWQGKLPAKAQHRFQSTLPRGERRDLHSVFFEISRFQSTLPRGERHFFSVPSSFNFAFQSTLPRGERRYSIRLASVTP